VSRNHCEIEYNKGKFKLKDSASKFGTLTLASGKVEILPGTMTAMQIGRSLVIFEVRNARPPKYNIAIKQLEEKPHQKEGEF